MSEIRVFRLKTSEKNVSPKIIGQMIMAKRTKTYSGKRNISIPEFLIDSIVEQMKFAKNQNNNTEKMLFKPDYCMYTDRGNVNTELKRILKNHFGITDITTHSLRHTFGTRCIESGMAPIVVKKLMGHKDIRVTLNTYTSVYDSFKERELEKVNNYFMNENMIETVKVLEEGVKEIEDRDKHIDVKRINTNLDVGWFDSYYK